jgi:hypothetical protein
MRSSCRATAPWSMPRSSAGNGSGCTRKCDEGQLANVT